MINGQTPAEGSEIAILGAAGNVLILCNCSVFQIDIGHFFAIL